MGSKLEIVDGQLRYTRLIKLSFQSALVGLVCIVTAAAASGAPAISVEVAKKCGALTAKSFPPRVIGNPAAGSARGAGAERRDFYKKCVANEGKTETPEK